VPLVVILDRFGEKRTVVQANCPTYEFLLEAEVPAEASGPDTVRIQGAPSALAAEFAAEHLAARLYRVRPATLDIADGKIALERKGWPEDPVTIDACLDLVATAAKKLPAHLEAAEAELRAGAVVMSGAPYRPMPVAADVRLTLAARRREFSALARKRHLRAFAVEALVVVVAIGGFFLIR
jgi:hypothetical protein